MMDSGSVEGSTLVSTIASNIQRLSQYGMFFLPSSFSGKLILNIP